MMRHALFDLSAKRGMKIHTPTGGSRMAAWFFPGFTLVLGLLYMFQPESRTSSAAFDSAKEIMPIHIWGIVFVVVALSKVVALLRRSAYEYSLAMCAGAGLYVMWAVFFLASSLPNSNVSLVSPLWPLFVAFFHIAMVSTVTGR